MTLRSQGDICLVEYSCLGEEFCRNEQFLNSSVDHYI